MKTNDLTAMSVRVAVAAALEELRVVAEGFESPNGVGAPWSTFAQRKRTSLVYGLIDGTGQLIPAKFGLLPPLTSSSRGCGSRFGPAGRPTTRGEEDHDMVCAMSEAVQRSGGPPQARATTIRTQDAYGQPQHALSNSFKSGHARRQASFLPRVGLFQRAQRNTQILSNIQPNPCK